MNDTICQENHRSDVMFAVLPEGQANHEGRHKCAGCSYEQGKADGKTKIEPNFRPEELPFSQAKTVRHKSALAAYYMGYTDGLRNVN